MKKISIGKLIGKRRLATAESRPVEIPDTKDIVHLQFRRFAGCPFCSVHLQSFVRRHAEPLDALLERCRSIQPKANAK